MSARPRPVADASHRQVWITVAAALLPGAVILANVLASGGVITGTDVGAAFVAILTPLVASEVARRRTVSQAEAETTPATDPRDLQGRALVPADTRLTDLLEQTLAAVTPQEPAGPPRTRSFPAVGSAKSMRADGPPSANPSQMAAADGPPNKQQGDWVGARAQAHDERLARERRPDPRGPRRHSYRGGPIDGGDVPP